MAIIVTPATPHIERPFGWKTYEVEDQNLTGTGADDTIVTLPAGTVILNAALVTTRAEAGATSSTVNIEVGATGAGDTALITGGADNLGTIGTTENTVTEANLTTINAVSLGGSDLVVNATITYVGTATTAPKYQLHLLCGRNEY